MQSIVTDVQQWCGRSILLELWSNHRVANVQALRCFSSGYYCCLCIISISLCVCVCVQNVCARLYALVKVTEGSFAATQRCLHCHEDRMSFDTGLQLLDEGMQQLRVISNMLAMARRACWPQSMSSGRRLSGTTAMTEEDATIMVLAAS